VLIIVGRGPPDATIEPANTLSRSTHDHADSEIDMVVNEDSAVAEQHRLAMCSTDRAVSGSCRSFNGSGTDVAAEIERRRERRMSSTVPANGTRTVEGTRPGGAHSLTPFDPQGRRSPGTIDPRGIDPKGVDPRGRELRRGRPAQAVGVLT